MKKYTNVKRVTNETKIDCKLRILGRGSYIINLDVAFFRHMIEAFSKFGLFDLEMNIIGDLGVDQHHTIEDCGIALGEAFRKALGNFSGINRSGFFILPMDDSLSVVAIDISGRPRVEFISKFRRRFCGDFDTDLLEDFFWGFAQALMANIFIKARGRNDHHKIEAIFKCFGKAMKMACSLEKRALKNIPSTKGVI